MQKRRYQPGFYIAINKGLDATRPLARAERTIYQDNAVKQQAAVVTEKPTKSEGGEVQGSATRDFPMIRRIAVKHRELPVHVEPYSVKEIQPMRGNAQHQLSTRSPMFEMFGSPMMFIGSLVAGLVIWLLFMLFVEVLFSGAALTSGTAAGIILALVLVAAIVIGIIFVLNSD